MGAISEIAYGFPGYDGMIPRSTATIAEVLRLHGYGTAMFGKAHVTPMDRANYHDGWIAACFHGRVPWIRSESHPFGDAERWEVYRISDDFSEAVDLAAQFPDRLAELRVIFDQQARAYDVYPLSDETLARALPLNRPSFLEGRTRLRLFRANVRIPELATIDVKNTSFTVRAQVTVPDGGAEGVVICQGGALAGWSLFVADGALAYTYNWFGHEVTTIAADRPLPSGRTVVGLRFDYDGGGVGKGGTASLALDGESVGRGRIERTVPFLFSMSGETLDVGVDTGSPVGPYPAGFPFTGEIDHVDIEIDAPPTDERRDDLAAGQWHGAMSTRCGLAADAPAS